MQAQNQSQNHFCSIHLRQRERHALLQLVDGSKLISQINAHPVTLSELASKGLLKMKSAQNQTRCSLTDLGFSVI